MNAETTVPQMLFLILLCINCIHAQDYLLVSAPHSKSSRLDNEISKEATEDADSEAQLASQYALRVRRRIPPLPRLGRQADDLVMAKLRRKRSTRLVEDRSIPLPRIGRVVDAVEDDWSPSEYGFDLGDYGVRSSLLPRIGYRSATVRAAPLPRMGRRSDDELGVVPFPRLG